MMMLFQLCSHVPPHCQSKTTQISVHSDDPAVYSLYSRPHSRSLTLSSASSVSVCDTPSHVTASCSMIHLENSRPAASAQNCCLSQVDGCGSHGNCILKHPGPVEALKLMLFRLQAVEAELQRKAASPPADQVESVRLDISLFCLNFPQKQVPVLSKNCRNSVVLCVSPAHRHCGR